MSNTSAFRRASEIECWYQDNPGAVHPYDRTRGEGPRAWRQRLSAVHRVLCPAVMAALEQELQAQVYVSAVNPAYGEFDLLEAFMSEAEALYLEG